jgi:hypothetical protein
VELFLVANLAFLAVDIALAHEVNAFRHRAEWVPIAFSPAASAALLLAMGIGGPVPTLPQRERGGPGEPRRRLARWLGLVVGWGAIVVGVAGLIFHLESAFFQEQTLKSLVYSAPFAAPLTYTGLGLLILLDRMVDAETDEWARWVVFLAAGGFGGNFVTTLADHAQNGFFVPSEWVGVAASALAVGTLVALVVVPDNRPLLLLSLAVMGVQVAVGLLGFYLHARGNLARPAASSWERFIDGAPVFAPLLFVDLAVLAVLGLWAQSRALARARAAADREDV